MKERMMTAIKIGDTINPWKMFHGAITPNWLLCRDEINFSDKLVYARLMQYAGQDGQCYPSLRTLAEELGCGYRTITRSIEVLSEVKLIHKFISVGTDGTKQSNRYTFLHHEWIEKALSQSAKMTPPYGQNGIRIESSNRINKNNLSSVNSSTITNCIKTNTDTITPSVAEEFKHLWKVYPKRGGKKMGKQAALLLFAKKGVKVRVQIVEGAKVYARSKQAKDGYAVDCSRFIRQSIWQDCLDEVEYIPVVGGPDDEFALYRED